MIAIPEILTLSKLSAHKEVVMTSLPVVNLGVQNAGGATVHAVSPAKYNNLVTSLLFEVA